MTAGRCGSDLAKQSSCVFGAGYQGEYEACRRAVMCTGGYYWERKQSNYEMFEVPELGGS